MLAGLRCGQYDYSSPTPGLIEIRLHSISDTTDLSYNPLNNFVLKITSVTALRTDLAQGPIFADLKAINRTTGVYNTLDVHAEDSSLVIGEAYLPPGDYLGVYMLIDPGGFVVLDGYRNIPVEKSDKFDATLKFFKPFHITEAHTTRIVLTIDLKLSLIKKSDSYFFDPHYYISSIQYQ